jgi:hypothetical protein
MSEEMVHIVTHMTIARQRFGKHIPGVTLSKIEGYKLLGKGPINTHSRTKEEKCFPLGPCRGIIRESDSEASYSGVQLPRQGIQK